MLKNYVMHASGAWFLYSKACHITDLWRNSHDAAAKTVLVLSCWWFYHALCRWEEAWRTQRNKGFCRAGKATVKLLRVAQLEVFIDLEMICWACSRILHYRLHMEWKSGNLGRFSLLQRAHVEAVVEDNWLNMKHCGKCVLLFLYLIWPWAHRLLQSRDGLLLGLCGVAEGHGFPCYLKKELGTILFPGRETQMGKR